MDHKEMILVEYLIENVLNRESDKDYQMVFKINSALYSGRMLQQRKNNNGFTRNYILKRQSYGFYEETYFYNTNNGAMDEKLREYFFADNNLDSDSFKSLLHYPSVIFSKIVDLVSKIDYVDNHFKEPYEIPPVLYDLTNLDTKQSFDFYLLNGEVLSPVSLIEIEE